MIFPLALTITAGALALAVAVTRPPVPPSRVALRWTGPAGDLRTMVRPAPAHVPAHGYAEGAPPGFSGGFTEQGCDACHFHAAPNTGPGALTLEGVPDRFVAGESYKVTISLTQPGMKLSGFQLTSRFKDDGAQAGTLARESPADARIAIGTQAAVHYAGQLREGAALVEPNVNRWTLMWTAPSSTRTVVFHVAANAANGDERADGDYVYTIARDILPRY